MKSGKGANRCRATYIVGYTAIAHPVRTQIRIQAHHQLQAFSSCCTKSFEPKLSGFQAKYRLGWRYYIYPHRARVTVSGNCKRSLHQEGGGVCVFQPHRYGADPGGTPHGCKTRASGAGTDVSFGSGRAVCGSDVPGGAQKNWALCRVCPGRANHTTMRWRKISSAASSVNWYIRPAMRPVGRRKIQFFGTLRAFIIRCVLILPLAGYPR